MKNFGKFIFTTGLMLILAATLTGCSYADQDQNAKPSSKNQSELSQTQTVQITQTQIVTQVSTQVSNDSAKYAVSVSDDFKKLVITKDGKAFLTTPIAKNDMGSDARLVKVTSKNLYAKVCATGFGGYILYDFCYGTLYRVDLNTKSVTDLKIAHAEDVSADEKTVASLNITTDERKIIVTNLDSKKSTTFAVDKKYQQFGDPKFSPDGTKIAYAAAVGSPGSESGVVIVIDLSSGKQSIVAKTSGQDHYFTVKGWKDNNVVDYLQN